MCISMHKIEMHGIGLSPPMLSCASQKFFHSFLVYLVKDNGLFFHGYFSHLITVLRQSFHAGAIVVSGVLMVVLAASQQSLSCQSWWYFHCF